MTIDDELLAEVDQLTATLQTTRSAFIRSALQLALLQHAMLEKEQRHAVGYAQHPVMPGEFEPWEAEQSWGEE
jgi:metal-responsive CopG/Arc/MetJ family transcriptional regulator